MDDRCLHQPHRLQRVEDRCALQCRSPRDRVEPPGVTAELPAALGDVEGDGESRPPQLVEEIAVAARAPSDQTGGGGEELGGGAVDVEALEAEHEERFGKSGGAGAYRCTTTTRTTFRTRTTSRSTTTSTSSSATTSNVNVVVDVDVDLAVDVDLNVVVVVVVDLDVDLDVQRLASVRRRGGSG